MRKYWLILLLISTNLFANDINYTLNSYNLVAADQYTDDLYFENWTRLDFSYKGFELGVQMEAHKPPVPHSLDTTGYGLYQRYLRYNGDNLQVTAGNFYTMLGRGLVLRSFENRDLRWDTNIDGGKLNLQTKYVDVKLLSGQPRDRSGKRLSRLDAGELVIKPGHNFHLGGTYLMTNNDAKKSVQRGSIFSILNLPTMSLYTEYAGRQNSTTEWGTGHAFIQRLIGM